MLLLSWVYRLEHGILRFFVKIALGTSIGHNLLLAGLSHLPLISLLLLVHVNQPGYTLREQFLSSLVLGAQGQRGYQLIQDLLTF